MWLNSDPKDLTQAARSGIVTIGTSLAVESTGRYEKFQGDGCMA